MELTRDQVIFAILGHNGAMLSASKSSYRHVYPDHLVTFNGMVYALKRFSTEDLHQDPALLLTSKCSLERELGIVLSKHQDVDKAYKVWLSLIRDLNFAKHHAECIWRGDLNITLSEGFLHVLSKLLNVDLYVVNEHDGGWHSGCPPRLERSIFTITDNTYWDSHYQRDSKGSITAIPIPEPSEIEKEEARIKAASQYQQEDYEEVDLKLYDLEEELDGDQEEYDCLNIFELEWFFARIEKDISPIHNFQTWLRDRIGVDLEKHYTDYYLTKEDNDSLKQLTGWWYRAFHGKWQSDSRVEKSLMWYFFDQGPSHFLEDPEWAVPGKLYRRIEVKN